MLVWFSQAIEACNFYGPVYLGIVLTQKAIAYKNVYDYDPLSIFYLSGINHVIRLIKKK